MSLLDDKNKEIFSLKKDINSFLEKTYEKLTPWQITQVARHPNRPHASDYINAFIKDFQFFQVIEITQKIKLLAV